MEATIRLFRALPISDHGKGECDGEILKQTLRHGYILSPEVAHDYPDHERLVSMIEAEVGLSPEEMNASFHKSWAKVKDSPIEQLVLEQMVHYLTTYGFESLGIYSESSVYFPNEALEIPDLEAKDLRLVVIKGYTKEELKAKMMDLLKSGIALAEDTMRDLVDVAMFVGVDDDDLGAVRNKEVSILLHEYLGKVPRDPVEFLRYLIFKSTDSTLLIKNNETVKAIAANKNIGAAGLVEKYKAAHGLERLAQIFYRFKPLWLAFRTNKAMRTLVNKIRKLAVGHHRPMKGDYLNEVTARIKAGTLDDGRLLKSLEGANVFRKIRLAYALNYRTWDVDSILYRVRNGKAWAADFAPANPSEMNRASQVVLDSIARDLLPKVAGKKVFIPEWVNYTLPATEKQFCGNFPAGSSIAVPEDIVFGIYWENVGHHRIDLDLSITNAGGKIGWDGAYRNDARSVAFSGDVTDATKGASELFYIGKHDPENFLVFVNYYNHNEKVEVPFKVLVAREPVKRFSKNYMVDPNNILAVSKTVISKKSVAIGLVSVTPEETRFHFVETAVSKSISSRSNSVANQTRNYLYNFYTHAIGLCQILGRAGAVMVERKEDAEIDLSPEVLEKDTFIGLMS